MKRFYIAQMVIPVSPGIVLANTSKAAQVGGMIVSIKWSCTTYEEKGLRQMQSLVNNFFSTRTLGLVNVFKFCEDLVKAIRVEFPDPELTVQFGLAELHLDANEPYPQADTKE